MHQVLKYSLDVLVLTLQLSDNFILKFKISLKFYSENIQLVSEIVNWYQTRPTLDKRFGLSRTHLIEHELADSSRESLSEWCVHVQSYTL